MGGCQPKVLLSPARGATLSSGEVIPSKEYPTSVQAALYWAVRRVAERSVGLDEEGKVKAPFVRLAIHGMVDTPQSDIVLGGGNVRPGKEEKPASDTVLRWVAETLASKLAERGVTVPDLQEEGSSRSPVVAIHRLGDDEVELFTVGADKRVVARRVARQGTSFSAGGIGLGYYRTGARFEVEDVSGKQRSLEFPGLGEEFHTIHAVTCSSLRMQKANREALAGVVSELLVGFSERFAEPGSSRD